MTGHADLAPSGAEIIDSARLMSGKGIDPDRLHINWAGLMKHKLGFTERPSYMP